MQNRHALNQNDGPCHTTKRYLGTTCIAWAGWCTDFVQSHTPLHHTAHLRAPKEQSVDCESLTPTRGATQQSVDCESLTPTPGATQQSVDCESLTPTQGATQQSVDCESLTPTRGATQQSVDSEIVPVSSIAPEGWGPKEGGNATSPLHSRGSPTKGAKSEVKTYARGHHDAPSISKYGSLVQLE